MLDNRKNSRLHRGFTIKTGRFQWNSRHRTDIQSRCNHLVTHSLICPFRFCLAQKLLSTREILLVRLAFGRSKSIHKHTHIHAYCRLARPFTPLTSTILAQKNVSLQLFYHTCMQICFVVVWTLRFIELITYRCGKSSHKKEELKQQQINNVNINDNDQIVGNSISEKYNNAEVKESMCWCWLIVFVWWVRSFESLSATVFLFSS